MSDEAVKPFAPGGRPPAPADGEYPLAEGTAVDEAAAEAFAAAAEEHPVLQETDDAAAQVEIDLDLAAMAAERDEYIDALRRLQADFENYKKRTQRQQAETAARAGENLVVKLLPVLDSIDLARQHGATEGVEPIAVTLIEILAKEGLERVEPVGQPFDPNEHEAVAHEAGEGGDKAPQVVGLMRAGYRWKGRLVRPAMVTVRG